MPKIVNEKFTPAVRQRWNEAINRSEEGYMPIDVSILPSAPNGLGIAARQVSSHSGKHKAIVTLKADGMAIVESEGTTCAVYSGFDTALRTAACFVELSEEGFPS